jgi:hypothetical protein
MRSLTPKIMSNLVVLETACIFYGIQRRPSILLGTGTSTNREPYCSRIARSHDPRLFRTSTRQSSNKRHGNKWMDHFLKKVIKMYAAGTVINNLPSLRVSRDISMESVCIL